MERAPSEHDTVFSTPDGHVVTLHDEDDDPRRKYVQDDDEREGDDEGDDEEEAASADDNAASTEDNAVIQHSDEAKTSDVETTYAGPLIASDLVIPEWSDGAIEDHMRVEDAAETRHQLERRDASNIIAERVLVDPPDIAAQQTPAEMMEPPRALPKQRFLDNLMLVVSPAKIGVRDYQDCNQLAENLTYSFAFTSDLKDACFTGTNQPDVVPLFRLAEGRLNGTLSVDTRARLLSRLSNNRLGQRLRKSTTLKPHELHCITTSCTAPAVCQLVADVTDKGSAMQYSDLLLLIRTFPRDLQLPPVIELLTSKQFSSYVRILFGNVSLSFSVVANALRHTLRNHVM